MTQHFTRSTISTAHFCKKCGRETQHRVDGVRLGPCLECVARLEAKHAQPVREPFEDMRKQGELFR